MQCALRIPVGRIHLKMNFLLKSFLIVGGRIYHTVLFFVKGQKREDFLTL